MIIELIVGGYLINFLLTLIIIFIDYRKVGKAPGSIILMALLPLIGLLLYLFFFENTLMLKKERRAMIAKTSNYPFPDPDLNEAALILGSYGMTITDYQEATFLNVNEFYDDLIAKIMAAEKEVLITTYAFGNDQVGKRIVQALLSLPSTVHVTILYDRFGTRRRGHLKKLRKRSEIFVAPYRSPLKRNQRTFHSFYHQKLTIVDQYSYVSSTNYEKKELSKGKVHDWMDLTLRLTGNITSSVRNKIVSDLIDSGYYHFEETSFPKANQLALLYSGRGRDYGRTLFYLETIISNAKKSVDIITPFLSPHQAVISLLTRIKTRGVTVRIIIPTQKNAFLPHLATRAFALALYQSGISIYFSRAYNHAKMVIVDDKISYFGSANFQAMSFYNNTEAGVAIFDPDLNQQLAAYFTKMVNSALLADDKIMKKIKRKRFSNHLAGLFGLK